MVKKETGRRSGGGGPKLTVGLLEETWKVLEGALASCNVYHRSN